MATKSPTTSVRSREVIGEEQFSQRREVFGKHDTVFLPLPSPSTPLPEYNDAEPILASNHGKATSNFKRNTAGYSSMRESRTEDRNIEFRARKYSDNFTSELNQSDDVDYRYSMTERTRRLSKLRREFLNSNLHEPGSGSPFARTGTRASMPANSVSVMRYKIESPNLYKFPFAEPYATPPPVRRIVVDLGPIDVNGEKENQNPNDKPKYKSLPNDGTSPKIDQQKLFEELLKRYSPQRKPVNWNLPPTRPRVVGSVPKSFSSMADSYDSTDKPVLKGGRSKSEDDDVFEKKHYVDPVVALQGKSTNIENSSNENTKESPDEELKVTTEIIQNGPDIISEVPQKPLLEEINKENDSKTSLAESEEKNDQVPELSTTPRQSKESGKKQTLEKYTDISIPKLIEKMTEEADDLENHKKDPNKVKRKRSFLDKLLRRNKRGK